MRMNEFISVVQETQAKGGLLFTWEKHADCSSVCFKEMSITVFFLSDLHVWHFLMSYMSILLIRWVDIYDGVFWDDVGESACVALREHCTCLDCMTVGWALMFGLKIEFFLVKDVDFIPLKALLYYWLGVFWFYLSILMSITVTNCLRPMQTFWIFMVFIFEIWFYWVIYHLTAMFFLNIYGESRNMIGHRHTGSSKSSHCVKPAA